jgi:hypothetical protein
VLTNAVTSVRSASGPLTKLYPPWVGQWMTLWSVPITLYLLRADGVCYTLRASAIRPRHLERDFSAEPAHRARAETTQAPHGQLSTPRQSRNGGDGSVESPSTTWARSTVPNHS